MKLEDIPATRRVVSRLYFAGFIDRSVRERALEILYPERLWKLWTSRLLLILSAVLILTGVVFFFAANWNRLTPFMKFGMIEAGIVLCLVGVWCYGLNHLIGRVLLLSAAVLVGVFLAVFGQVYQTGADSWTVFAGWSALILGWALVARFLPLWWIWLVVTNVALFASLWQTTLADVVFGEDRLEMTPFVSFAVLNGVALALSEVGRARGVSWLQEPISRLVLTLVVLYSVFMSTVGDPLEGGFPLTMPGFLLGIACGGFLYWFFRFRSRDMWCFSAVVLFCVLFVETVFFRVLEPDGPDWLLLFALLTIGLFTLACWHVIKVQNTKDVDDG